MVPELRDDKAIARDNAVPASHASDLSRKTFQLESRSDGGVLANVQRLSRSGTAM